MVKFVVNEKESRLFNFFFYIGDNDQIYSNFIFSNFFVPDFINLSRDEIQNYQAIEKIHMIRITKDNYIYVSNILYDLLPEDIINCINEYNIGPNDLLDENGKLSKLLNIFINPNKMDESNINKKRVFNTKRVN